MVPKPVPTRLAHLLAAVRFVAAPDFAIPFDLSWEGSMQWLGHVMRMPVGRYPAMVFGCKPVGGRRRVGGPRATYRHTYKCMLTTVGVTSHEAWWQEAYAAAQDRGSWCAMVKGLVMPMHFTGVSHRTRNFLDRAEKRKTKRYVF